jgi:3-methyl-2-oxobutanoate hydroxymethyltransferase
MSSWPENRRISVLDLLAAKKRQEPWSMLTSYDAMTAGLFEQSGAKALLVGDTAAMVVYGHETTLPVTVDELIPLAAAVVRGTKRAFVVGDLPFGSYQESPAQAVRTATRFMKEAGVHGIKLEGGVQVLPQIEAIVAAGIPVMGHLGLTPQSVHALGGMQRVQGRGEAGAHLLEDAKALEHAGVFSMVVEAVPAELGARVAAEVAVPVVGIGAGNGTDAQVIVWQDMLGLTEGRVPKFVKQYANLREVMGDAVTAFVTDVQSRAYPDESHSYD